MPLPKPRKNEPKKNFISRCMDNEQTKREFPNRQQRLAVCNSQEKKRGSKIATNSVGTWLISSKPLR